MMTFPDDVLSRVGNVTALGHDKRNACFLRQLKLVLSSPGTSPTQAAGLSSSPAAQTMSLYRFLDNPDISLPALRKIRRKTVLEEIPQGSEVLVVHDVTRLDYSTHNSKMDRRPIGDHKGMGYEYVACTAVDPANGRFFWHGSRHACNQRRT